MALQYDIFVVFSQFRLVPAPFAIETYSWIEEVWTSRHDPT
jgi:hypothetical protein